MELQRLIGIVSRNALRIIVIAVVAGAAVGLITATMPKIYQANTKLVVAGALIGNPPQIDQMDAASRLAQTLAELASSRPVVAAALASVGDKTTPEAFRDQLSARAAPGSLFITISVRGTEAGSSATLANAIATQLILQAPALLGATSAATVPAVSVLETALPPLGPSSPSAILYGLLAAIAAAFVAIVVAIIAASRGNRRPESTGQVSSPSWPEPAGVSVSQVRDPRT